MANTVTSVAGQHGGAHVGNSPLTTTLMRDNAPDLLRSDVDNRVVRIRPMSTPVDQISRMVGARRARSMVVEYYSVDTKAQEVTSSGSISEVDAGLFDGYQLYNLPLDNSALVAPTDTLMTPASAAGVSYVLYVVDRPDTKTARVICLNGAEETNRKGIISADLRNATLVRMGRASGELAVQTAQFEALPRKENNFCQIFKAQVEQSVNARLSAKEVGWSFSDQEEVAVMDMRMGMEKSFLFGSKGRLTIADGTDEVYFTDGIWNQAGGLFEYHYSSFTADHLVDMMHAAFTGASAGSRRKILLAGSGLISRISKLKYERVVGPTDKVTRWGIDFHEIQSKFGSLYVVHSEVFDQCGHGRDGIIIDPEYMVKYVFQPFQVERIDLKSSGVRNTEAVVITEASCLALRHPKSHLRVICKGE